MKRSQPSRPSAYPPPLTSPEQREINRELRNEIRDESSPIAQSNYPLDGIAGILLITSLSGLLAFMDYHLLVDRRVEKFGGSLVVSFIAIHVGALAFIGWAVVLRRRHRRLRRLGRGQCLRCGYDLQQIESDRCPECGQFRAST